MQPMNRIQRNLVATQERRFLNWACSRMPEAVTSDHLTAISVFAAVLVPLGFLASRASPWFLLLAAFGFALNWLGDSLDGSLARYRNTTRPQYGYFLDHSVDAFATLLMVGGMGLSVFVRLDVALYVVAAYLILSIHVFLKNHVTGTFQLTFIFLGPTEVRIFYVALTLIMLVAGPMHRLGLAALSDYDVALLICGSIFMLLFVSNTARMLMQLRAIEGDGRRPRPLSMQPRSGGPASTSPDSRASARSELSAAPWIG